jgi:hypothetical protein
VHLYLLGCGALDHPRLASRSSDIPSEKQVGVLEGLTAKVKSGGRLFVREPLRFIEAERLRYMLSCLGWQEQQSGVEEVFSQGKAYEGIWVRG